MRSPHRCQSSSVHCGQFNQIGTAPLLVALYDHTFQARSLAEMLRRRWGLYACLAATWAILALFLWRSPHGNTISFSADLGALDYAMNQCVVLVRYLRLAFWPHPLLCDYGPPVPLTFGAVLPYAGVLAALLAATSAALIYRLKVGFLGAWFFVILIPTSSFVPILTEVGAERRMYLPLAAVIVLVVIGGDLLLQYAAQYAETARRNWARPDTSGLISRGGGIVQVAIALVLSVMTVKRNAEYRHPITLWKQAVTQVPNNARAHTNLGVAQVDQGDIATAIGHYRCGLELDPGDPVTHNNLGFALAIQGTLDEAIAHYRRALKQDPDYTAAHANLAAALVAQGQFDLAIHHFRRVVELDPGKSVVHNDLGAALSALGDIDAAIAQFHRSLELDPDYMIARQNLALVLELKNEQVKKPGGRGQ